MNSRRHTPVLLALTLAMLAPATAMAGEPITDCVDLGNDQEILRDSGQQFSLRNGGDHYRVHFQRRCDSILIASRVDILSQDKTSRLCATDTRVKTGRETCHVASVETMTAEEFARQKRRASR
ncbi:hypothetical protein [Pseudoxanthomonas sp. PXM02]|uniref:hypothetical protein n=1 Tax=Pseudoxanthomonas sp. PXM02 TaxID=2769294 RepID=UPI00177BBE7E|nr:hypothetical protein [Pseudoxanthomonas sp. PXM02]MBD9477472.1 hypothetical protein [Pseudoxanthomonas sp. PXM02]